MKLRMGGMALLACLSVFGAAQTGASAEDVAKKRVSAEPYNWRNVAIVAGGFVDGIIFHPKAKDVTYLRSDMGGAYRRDTKQKIWVPITDWTSQSDWNLHGIESLALDPKDPKRVYLAAGTYTNEWAGNAAMLRSTDSGRTWQRTDMPFKMGGNEDGRSAGERLAVDPNAGNILFFGSRHNGLWRSSDYGATWKQVETFPVTGRTNGVGVVWVVFPPQATAGRASEKIYVGVQQKDGPGIYFSEDGGTRWEPVAGQPAGLLPHQAQFDSGTLYITCADAPGPNGMSSGEAWKYEPESQQWTNISPLPPKSGGFAGISVSRKQPGTLVVSTMDRWGPGDDIFLSRNGGKSWVGLKDKAILDVGLSPFLKWGGEKPRFGWWMGAVALDPFQPEHLIFATGATIWETFDLNAADTGKPTHWTVGGKGVEQVAVTDLISPPQGAHLVSALGDIGGFRHDDLTVSPPAGLSGTPLTGTTESVDFAEAKPNVMVRVGSGKPGQHGAISQDGGATWKAFGSEPQGTRNGGHIAISADGSSMVWAADGAAPVCSFDGGATWRDCEGLPKNARPIGSRDVPGRYYALDGSMGRLLVSEDGGAHFAERGAGLPHVNSDTRLRPVAGQAGELWFAASGKLYRSADDGKTFAPIITIDGADAIGFGKAAPGRRYPALYLIGKVAGVEGIFRSDNRAETWTRINDAQHQFGAIGPIIGDPRIYGRVYVGSNGRGILYADPVSIPHENSH